MLDKAGKPIHAEVASGNIGGSIRRNAPAARVLYGNDDVCNVGQPIDRQGRLRSSQPNSSSKGFKAFKAKSDRQQKDPNKRCIIMYPLVSYDKIMLCKMEEG